MNAHWIVVALLAYSTIILTILYWVFRGWVKKVNCVHDYEWIREVDADTYSILELRCKHCGHNKVFRA
jgi:hypothetical protein